MLVLMREDLARGARRADQGRAARLQPVRRRLPPDRAAAGRLGGGPRDQGRAGGRRASSPSAVNYVNRHGTGTAKNDPAETAATKYGLGEHAYETAVSTKSMIGHLLGAAGAVENIVTVRAIETQTAPPTANYTTADPECDLDYVPNEARAMNIDVAVSNNFAFGGANASIVWAKPGARPAPPAPDATAS